MEKSIKFTREELIKYIGILSVVISAFLAVQYQSTENTKAIRELKGKNIMIERQLQEQAALTAELKGTLGKIDQNVQIIVTAITNSSLNPGRQ